VNALNPLRVAVGRRRQRNQESEGLCWPGCRNGHALGGLASAGARGRMAEWIGLCAPASSVSRIRGRRVEQSAAMGTRCVSGGIIVEALGGSCGQFGLSGRRTLVEPVHCLVAAKLELPTIGKGPPANEFTIPLRLNSNQVAGGKPVLLLHHRGLIPHRDETAIRDNRQVGSGRIVATARTARVIDAVSKAAASADSVLPSRAFRLGIPRR
jgi:hypothetical protein